MNLTESLKKNLKETEDNLKVIKEPGVGAVVEDSNGKRYYQAGSTSQGYCFKDLDAYKNDRDAVCYICEFGFEDLGNEDLVIPVEDLTGDKLAKAIEYGGVSTHNSIIEELKTYWNYIEEPIKPEFLEKAAEFIFDTVDWQSTSTLIDEVDWNGYTGDTENEEFEDQIMKESDFEYIGKDDWDRHIIKSKNTGTYFVDVNLSKVGEDKDLSHASWCTVTGNDPYEGEPLAPMKDDVVVNIVNPEDIPSDFQREDYSLLSRLQSDCDYFLGNGNGFEGHLWAGSVEKQIAKMRELYDGLKTKPDWLSLEDIDNYETKMLAKKNGSLNESDENLSTDEINLKNIREVLNKSGIINEKTLDLMSKDILNDLKNNYASDCSSDGIFYTVVITDAIKKKIDFIHSKMNEAETTGDSFTYQGYTFEPIGNVRSNQNVSRFIGYSEKVDNAFPEYNYEGFYQIAPSIDLFRIKELDDILVIPVSGRFATYNGDDSTFNSVDTLSSDEELWKADEQGYVGDSDDKQIVSDIKSEKDYGDIAHENGWSLNSFQLYNLATIYINEPEYKEKIEELLTDINYHSECSELMEDPETFRANLMPDSLFNESEDKTNKKVYTYDDFKTLDDALEEVKKVKGPDYVYLTKEEYDAISPEDSKTCDYYIKDIVDNVLNESEDDEDLTIDNLKIGIKIVSEEEIDKMVDNFVERSGEVPDGLFLAGKDGVYTAVDNTTGNCWTESFPTREQAIAFLKGAALEVAYDKEKSIEFLNKYNINESEDDSEDDSYYVEVWPSELEREYGEGIIVKYFHTKEEAVVYAEELWDDNDYAAVEAGYEDKDGYHLLVCCADGEKTYGEEEFKESERPLKEADSEEDLLKVLKAYFEDNDRNYERDAYDIISKYAISDEFPKVTEYIKEVVNRGSKEPENNYAIGSVEHTVQNVANEFGIDLDSKTPFEYFYAPDSDNEEDSWYSSDYDWADFYDKVLHDLGYGENPILNDCKAEVHEVSDGKYTMTLFIDGKEHSIDLRAWDNLENVVNNVETIKSLLRPDLKESYNYIGADVDEPTNHPKMNTHMEKVYTLYDCYGEVDTFKTREEAEKFIEENKDSEVYTEEFGVTDPEFRIEEDVIEVLNNKITLPDDLEESDNNTLDEGYEDDYQPKYRVLDKGLVLTNGGYHNNSNAVYGTIRVKGSDTVGNTFDIWLDLENDALYVFPRGTDVKTINDEIYTIDSDEAANEWIELHGDRIQRKDITDFMNREKIDLDTDMKNDIIFGIRELINKDDIAKVNYQ